MYSGPHIDKNEIMSEKNCRKHAICLNIGLLCAVVRKSDQCSSFDFYRAIRGFKQ